MTAEITIITDATTSVRAEITDGEARLDGAALSTALGWDVKAEGLCRGDRCVAWGSVDPRRGDRVDLAGAAAMAGRIAVVDTDAAIAALSLASSSLDDTGPGGLQAGMDAPDVELVALDGSRRRLSDWSGRRRLLVCFATWCGCRYDLPGWQELADELAETGLQVIAVAFDHSPDDVRPFAEGVRMPLLVDERHLMSERYAISNVPTVVWIDEHGRIARPNSVAFGSDLFRDFTGVEAGPHLDAVRRWAATGEVPSVAGDSGVAPLGEDEVRARLHFRIGDEALRRGDRAAAERHLRRAGELAPLDFTVRRAAMPLLGEDPFGEDFLGLYEQWRTSGSPYHGLPAMTESGG